MSAMSSSVGRKLAMAITGLILIGYLVGHLLGNFNIFAGPGESGVSAIDAWSDLLHAVPPLLWAVRVFLLAAFVLHIYLGVVLTLENRRARPVAYAKKKHQRASLSSKTMIWTGLMTLVFVVYHVLHFTTRHLHGAQIAHHVDGHDVNVFGMVVESFQSMAISTIYMVALVGLLLHLSHGISSMLQTFGLTNKELLPRIELGGRTLGALLILGFASIPVAILIGLLSL
jgi:succinate dehydrogenase / fumarate reductase cytochrome b subunit